MFELSLVIVLLLAISFLCSVLESVILSLTRPYIQLLIDRQTGSAGKILKRLKDNIEEPISAILTLNTISHTVGAAVSGAFALQIFGSRWMALFSAVLTLLILIFSEIIPKTIGANYWKNLAPPAAYILKIMVFILKPLIVPIHWLSRMVSGKNPGAMVSRQEIYNFVKIGHTQGVIKPSELKIVESILELQNVKIKDIMTPRTVVFWLAPERSVSSLLEEKIGLEFSRIPLYSPGENKIEGFVMRRDIMNHATGGKTDVVLKSIAFPPEYIIESASAYRLLNHFMDAKTHLTFVLNELGDYTGIVTLEDAIEALLGVEIMDEFDKVADMRELAVKKTSGKINWKD